MTLRITKPIDSNKTKCILHPSVSVSNKNDEKSKEVDVRYLLEPSTSSFIENSEERHNISTENGRFKKTVQTKNNLKVMNNFEDLLLAYCKTNETITDEASNVILYKNKYVLDLNDKKNKTHCVISESSDSTTSTVNYIPIQRVNIQNNSSSNLSIKIEEPSKMSFYTIKTTNTTTPLSSDSYKKAQLETKNIELNSKNEETFRSILKESAEKNEDKQKIEPDVSSTIPTPPPPPPPPSTPTPSLSEVTKTSDSNQKQENQAEAESKATNVSDPVTATNNKTVINISTAKPLISSFPKHNEFFESKIELKNSSNGLSQREMNTTKVQHTNNKTSNHNQTSSTIRNDVYDFRLVSNKAFANQLKLHPLIQHNIYLSKI